MNVSHSIRTPKKNQCEGSVLLVTLLVVSLLLVMTLALVVQIRVESRTVLNHQHLRKARHHATLGLQLAIAELQLHTGPDQRVTGTANQLIPDSITINPSTTGAAARASLDAFWRDRRNPHWTAAWHNANTSTFNPDSPADYQATPELRAWLVSQEPGTAVIDPNVTISNLTAASGAGDLLTDANGQSHILLVSPDPHRTGPEALARAVTAPRVRLDTAAASTPGHFAWWVGDEGVKARANLTDAYAQDNSAGAHLLRAASAQRPVIEAMTDTGNDGMAPHYPANHPDFDKLNSLNDFNFLVPDPVHEAELSARFHDLTLHSRSVLADVKNGGLKRDLSYILGQPDIPSLRAALQAALPGAIQSGAPSNRVLHENITPLMQIPGTLTRPAISDPNTAPGIFAYTPTWEQLWSFHNMGNRTTDTPAGVMDGTGRAVPRLQSRTEHGIHPITIQAKLFYRLTVDGGGNISIGVRPLVVLANPYSVPLAPRDYTVRLTFRDLSPGEIRFGELAPEEVGIEPDTTRFNDTQASLPNGGLGEVVFTLRSPGMPPGEAHVFTLAEDGIVIPDDVAGQRNLAVLLVNDFDPGAYLIQHTGVQLPPHTSGSPTQTYATLYQRRSAIETARLYMDYDPLGARDRRLLQAVNTWTLSADSSPIFLVFPTRSDLEGGGFAYTFFDIGPVSQKQHALFLQQNYRTNLINGFHGATSETHLLQWARGHNKKGTPGNHNYFNAHLLGITHPDFTFTNVRWGPINTGLQNSSYETGEPPTLGDQVGFRNLFYDIPTPGVPVSSLGELQHINVNSFVDADTYASHSGNHNTLGRNHQRAISLQSWQNNYSISNSHPNARVARHRLMDTVYSGFHYDGSYIWNDILWDRFFFSGFPASGPFDFKTDLLVNSRHTPFRDRADIAWDDPSSFRGDQNPANPANSRMAAQNLMVAGGFNINSTSFEAWKALFSSLREVEIGNETDVDRRNAPFPRTLRRLGGSEKSETANHENSWNGFRNLSTGQINRLAEEMVLHVRLRGPFLSLSDFVNRRLVARNEDPHGLGLHGALQAAINRVINHAGEVDPLFRVATSTHVNHIVDQDYRAESLMSGFPGYLLQADVLSAIGQHLSARSDTVRVRAYGDVVNPLTGAPEARAWCEAVLQRVPDYVVTPAEGGDAPHETPVHPVNQLFGRRYHVVAFRWLSPEDL